METNVDRVLDSTHAVLEFEKHHSGQSPIGWVIKVHREDYLDLAYGWRKHPVLFVLPVRNLAWLKGFTCRSLYQCLPNGRAKEVALKL